MWLPNLVLTVLSLALPCQVVAEDEIVEDLKAQLALPSPEVKQPPEGRREYERHADSFQWGLFRFTWSNPEKRPPHGQWHVKCPFHRLSQKTGCTRALKAGETEDSKDLAKRVLQGWCLQAPSHERKSSHCAIPLKNHEALPAEILEFRLASLPQPPDILLADDELDALEEAEPEAEAKEGKARPKRKSKAAAKGRPTKKAKPAPAKPKAKGRGKRKSRPDSVDSRAGSAQPFSPSANSSVSSLSSSTSTSSSTSSSSD